MVEEERQNNTAEMNMWLLFCPIDAHVCFTGNTSITCSAIFNLLRNIKFVALQNKVLLVAHQQTTTTRYSIVACCCVAADAFNVGCMCADSEVLKRLECRPNAFLQTSI